MSRSYKLSLADGLPHRNVRASAIYRIGGKLVRKVKHHQERRSAARRIAGELQEVP